MNDHINCDCWATILYLGRSREANTFKSSDVTK